MDRDPSRLPPQPVLITGPDHEPPVWDVLAFLDDPAMRVPQDCVILVVDRGNMRAVLPFSPVMLPAGAGRELDEIIEMVVKALYNRQEVGDMDPDQPVLLGGRYSLHDGQNHIERLTIGHFRPVRSPGGVPADAARFSLRDPLL